MKSNIKSILKPGCTLKAKKLTKKQIELLQETIKKQEGIPKSFRFPYA
jgi:hypothetical protein